MSIERVGSSTAVSVDASEAEKERRRLADEQKQNLARVELNYNDQLEKSEAARNAQLRQIFEDQSDIIDTKRQSSEERIREVRDATENRLKQFEAQASRMTDDAQKQFIQKASALERTSQELDSQRRYMLMQHSDAMKENAKEQEKIRGEAIQNARRETDQLYSNQKKYQEALSQTNAAALDKMRIENQENKRKVANESESEIAKLTQERDKNATVLKNSVDFAKRTTQEQLEDQRAKYEASRSHMQTEHEARSQIVNQDNRNLINQQETQGKKKVQQARDYYAFESHELDKNHAHKIQEANFQASKKLASIDNEYKTDEHLMKQAYSYRKAKLQEESQANIKAITNENTKIRDKLKEEAKRQETELKSEQERLFKDQHETVKNELLFQMNRGEKQVNAVVADNTKTLQGHSARQSDSFYKLQKINMSVVDDGEVLTVKVPVPEHEQQAIRLTHQHNSVTVSGSRRAETKLKDDMGGSASTNTFQSYSESFPIMGKIDMSKIKRSYQDGVVIFKVPKV